MADPNFPNLPPEYQFDLARIMRQRALADALFQRAVAPRETEMAGKIAVKRSPLSLLAQGLTAYLGNRQVNQADEQIQGVQSAYQNALSQEGQGLMSTYAKDPRAAIAQALISKFPQYQAMGKDWQNQQEKRLEAGAGALKETNPMGALEVLRKGDLGAQIPPAPSLEPKFGQESGYTYALTRNQKGEPHVNWAPRPTQVNVGTKGELAIAGALGKQVPEVLASARKDYMDATQGRQQAEQIMTLAKDPAVITGFGAGIETGVAALSAKLGFSGPDAPAKTQALLSALAANTLEASRDLKGAISDKEKPFLEEAKSGKITYTPQAIQHLAGLALAVSHNKTLNAIRQWNGTVQGIPDEGLKSQASSMYPLPPLGNYTLDPKLFPETAEGRVRYQGELFQPGAQTSKPISIEEWLKKQNK